MLSEVEQKMAKVKNLVEVKKLEEACDADCQAKCDKDADEMTESKSHMVEDGGWVVRQLQGTRVRIGSLTKGSWEV